MALGRIIASGRVFEPGGWELIRTRPNQYAGNLDPTAFQDDIAYQSDKQLGHARSFWQITEYWVTGYYDGVPWQAVWN